MTHPLLFLDRHPIVGHRGNAAHAPENTLASFQQAVDAGVDALELDVRLSADGEVVVHHDPTVDRTTDGRGAVAAMRWSSLAALDAGARFTRDRRHTPYRGIGIGIPRFADVLSAFPSTPLLIELKVPDVAIPLRTLIERADAAARCIVASFHAAALTPFAGSAIAIGSSQRDLLRLLPSALRGRGPTRLPYTSIAMPARHWGIPLPMRGYAASARTAGVPVHVWTVNDPAEARRLWQRGVCGIISDDPARMLAERARVFSENV
ncbi:MAG: glycerophosphodiester phosphodiesterase family protein [Gemmatimonadaceae bacterium]|nr:glycerophosphodiester phosphodiesterase family protein [Gemmatimonadaceae bacterium]